MMLTYRQLMMPFVVSALLGLPACGENADEPVEENAPYISFSSRTSATKAGAGDSAVVTDEKLREASFGVYGFKTPLQDASISTNLDNVFATSGAQEVGWDLGDGCWSYSPKRKWEMSLYYRFRAFWPYDVNLNPASNATRLGVEYRATTEQYDLLVAYATRHPLEEGIGSVPMKFHHALSALKFNIKYVKDKTPEGTKDYVTRFYLKGMYSVGYLIYGQRSDSDDVEKIEWLFGASGSTFDSTSEMFNWTGREEFSVGADGESKAATVFDNDHLVLIPPQTLSAASNPIPTTAYFFTETGGEAVNKVDLPCTVLEPGKIYTFTLLIHSTYMGVNIDIKEWDVLQSNVSITL